MKKAFGVVFLLVVIVLGFFGYQYWNSTYNGVESYAKVTQGTKHASKNNDGPLIKLMVNSITIMIMSSLG